MTYKFPITQNDLERVGAGCVQNLSAAKLSQIRSTYARSADCLREKKVPANNERIDILTDRVEFIDAELQHRGTPKLLHRRDRDNIPERKSD